MSDEEKGEWFYENREQIGRAAEAAGLSLSVFIREATTRALAEGLPEWIAVSQDTRARRGPT